MMTSKLFLGTWLVAGLMIAASVWNGDNAYATIMTALFGGGVVGAFINFMWGKIGPRL